MKYSALPSNNKLYHALVHSYQCIVPYNFLGSWMPLCHIASKYIEDNFLIIKIPPLVTGPNKQRDIAVAAAVEISKPLFSKQHLPGEEIILYEDMYYYDSDVPQSLRMKREDFIAISYISLQNSKRHRFFQILRVDRFINAEGIEVPAPGYIPVYDLNHELENLREPKSIPVVHCHSPSILRKMVIEGINRLLQDSSVHKYSNLIGQLLTSHLNQIISRGNVLRRELEKQYTNIPSHIPALSPLENSTRVTYRYAILSVENYVSLQNDGTKAPQYVAIPVSKDTNTDEYLFPAVLSFHHLKASVRVEYYLNSTEPVENYLPYPFENFLPPSATLHRPSETNSWRNSHIRPIPELHNYIPLIFEKITMNGKKLECGYALVRIQYGVLDESIIYYRDNCRPPYGWPHLQLPIGFPLPVNSQDVVYGHCSLLEYSFRKSAEGILSCFLEKLPTEEKDLLQNSVAVSQAVKLLVDQLKDLS